jgi:hypothetical protein
MGTDTTTTTRRALISAMQVTLDGYVLGPEGDADSFDSWADGRELLPPVDAFVLAGGMFPGYEQFWAAILDEPSAASDILGRDPYPREVTYARVAAQTPHLVLSKTSNALERASTRRPISLIALRAGQENEQS